MILDNTFHSTIYVVPDWSSVNLKGHRYSIEFTPACHTVCHVSSNPIAQRPGSVMQPRGTVPRRRALPGTRVPRVTGRTRDTREFISGDGLCEFIACVGLGELWQTD